MHRFNAGSAIQFAFVIVLGSFGLSASRAPAQQRNPIDPRTTYSCISTRQASREQQTQPGVWEHSVYVANACNRPIELTICYAFSSDCITTTAAPNRECPHELGVKTQPGFQYTIRFD
jgi:hypothetical protein